MKNTHKQLQATKLSHAPTGVSEGVGCARQQPYAARNDSRGVFVNSKSRAGSTKKNEINISFHAGEASMIGGHMTDEKSDFTKECAVLQAGVFWSVLGTSYPQKLWRKKITSPLA